MLIKCFDHPSVNARTQVVISGSSSRASCAAFPLHIMSDFHGMIRLYSPSKAKSLAIPISRDTTVGELHQKLKIPALFLQLGLQHIRQLSVECRPLVIQLDILAALGYDLLEERLRVGHSPRLWHIFRFYIALPEPSLWLSKPPKCFAVPYAATVDCLVRPADGLFGHRWRRRKCAIKHSTLWIEPETEGKQHQELLHVPFYEVDQCGHKTLRLVPNMANNLQEWHFRFDHESNLEEWKRRLAQDRLVPEADFSNQQLLFLPAELFLLGQHRLVTGLNLRRNSLQSRPSPPLILGGSWPSAQSALGWLDDIGAFPSLRQLNLADNKLQCFPSGILQLNALTELDLSGNKIVAIPPNIRLLTNLTQLNLANNLLSQLPTALAKCSALKILDLSFNRLTYIPQVLSRLSNLSSWSLAGNMIVDPKFPKIGMARPNKVNLRLNSLKVFQIRPIHSPLCSSLTSLDFRDCGTKLVELELGALSRLESLHCERNGIRNIWLNGSALRELFASYNELNSLVIMPLPERLSILQLGHNQMRSLPDWTTELANMLVLDVQSNLLRKLPARIFMSLPSLRHLNAANNRLENLPESMQHCQLESLLLNGNRLETLPTDLFRVSAKLRFLNCSSNYLTQLPRPLCQPGPGILLKELNLSFNRLTADALQALLGQFRHLRLLDLSHNRLRWLPPQLANLRLLEELNIGANRLQSLPGSLFSLPNLHTLRAHSNLIGRSPAFRRAKSLKIVDFSGNKLHECPSKTTLPSMLEQLDLTCNQPMGKNSFRISLPASAELVDLDRQNRLLEGNSCFGFSQSRGQRQRLCLRQMFFHCPGATFFALIDGGNNAEIADSVRRHLPQVVASQQNIESASAAKLALLRVLEKLGPESHELGAAVLLLGIEHARDQKVRAALFGANCGHCSALLVRHAFLEPVWLAHEKAPTTPMELERIRAAGAILTEDGLINGFCPSGRSLGFTALFPAILPAPSKFWLQITDQCHSVVIANRHVWSSLEIHQVEALVKRSRSAQQAAKDIQDAVRSNNCEENAGIIVIGLGRAWDGSSHFPAKLH